MAFDVHAYLNSFTNWEPQLDTITPAGVSPFSLDAMERLLLAFGRPDDKLKFAHVAGTKGKGSTCVFLAYILRAAGYRVGLYTSPHLYTVNERIRVLEPGAITGDIFEGAITDEELSDRARFYQEPVDHLRYNEKFPVTYFEYLTALAVSYFAFKKCDVVVLETGLGGRLDATNVFETSVCAITSIGFDHGHILGKSLPVIAAEKAGIIKGPAQRVTLLPQVPDVADVLGQRCGEFFIRPTVIGQDMPVIVHEEAADGLVFDVDGRRAYHGLKTVLTGAHQALNAAAAISMAEDLEMFGVLIDEDKVFRGIREARWPLRFEIVPGKPSVIFDCAHTVESARACADTVEKVFPGSKAILVLGISADKEVKAVAQELSRVASAVVATRAEHPRAFHFSTENVKDMMPHLPVSVVSDLRGAMSRARALAGQDGVVLVAGSVFVCAQARREI